MTTTATPPLTKSEWQDRLFPLMAKASKLDPIQCEHHPAFRGLIEKIDRLIQYGLSHEYIDMEGAARL